MDFEFLSKTLALAYALGFQSSIACVEFKVDKLVLPNALSEESSNNLAMDARVGGVELDSDRRTGYLDLARRCHEGKPCTRYNTLPSNVE